MRRPGQRAAGLALLLVLALLLASCGSSGSGSDDKQKITDVLTNGLTSKDPKVVCEGSLSSDFLTRLYGSVARCHTVEGKADAQANQAKTVAVSGVEVDGDKATATVALKGGDQDGATGELSLVAQDGDWRVSDLSIGFLRSEFQAGMRSESQLDAKVKDCIGKKVLALGDADLRDLAYGSIGERPAAQKQLVGIFADCQEQTSSTGGDSSGDGSISFLRKKFEEGVVNSLEGSGVSAAGIECVKRELRKRVSDKQIVALIGTGGKDVPPEIATAAAGALAACKATG